MRPKKTKNNNRRLFCLRRAFMALAVILAPSLSVAEDPLTIAMPITLQIDSFEPLASNYTPHGFLAQNLFTPLLLQDQEGKLVGGSAQTWEYRKGGQELAIKLNPNYRWSNGDPVSASDFRRGFEKLLSSQSDQAVGTANASLLVGRSIVGIEERLNGDHDAHLGIRVEGDFDLIYELTAPYALAMSDLTIANWAIPVHMDDASHDGTWMSSPHKHSNGAYFLDSYSDGKAVLRANPYFGGDPSAYKNVEFIDQSQGNIIDLFIDDKVDILLGPFGSQQGWLIEQFEDQIFSLTSPRVYVLRSNPNSGILSDPDIRRAIFNGLDRENFSQSFFDVAHVPLAGLIPQGVNGYEGGDLIEQRPGTFSERRELAASLLKEKGISPDNPVEISLIVATEVFGYSAIQSFVTSYLSSLGIIVKATETQHYVDAVDAYDAGQVDMMIDSSWQYDAWGYLSFDELYQESVHGSDDSKVFADLLKKVRQQTTFEGYTSALDNANAFSLDRLWIMPVASAARIAFAAPELGEYRNALHELNLNYVGNPPKN